VFESAVGYLVHSSLSLIGMNLRLRLVLIFRSCRRRALVERFPTAWKRFIVKIRHARKLQRYFHNIGQMLQIQAFTQRFRDRLAATHPNEIVSIQEAVRRAFPYGGDH
jgi:hypothetical protein